MASGRHAYRDAVLTTSGLQSFWLLNDPVGSTTAHDSGPAGITGAATGTFGAPGYTSDGETGFKITGDIDFGANYNFPGTQAFTIELLFRYETASGPTSMLVDNYGPATADDGWAVFSAGGGNLHFWRYNAGTGQQLNTLGVFTINVWHHLALTYDGTNMNAYIDGALTGSSPVPSAASLPAVSRHLFVGQGNGWNGQDGTYQCLAIYNVALSGATVADHVSKI